MDKVAVLEGKAVVDLADRAVASEEAEDLAVVAVGLVEEASAATKAVVDLAAAFEKAIMKQIFPAMALLALLYGLDPSSKLFWPSDVYAESILVAQTVTVAAPLPGSPKKPAAPGKKWVHPSFKGAQGAGWIQVPDKPVVTTTGPAATAPRGSEIVGDHWHWPGDYMTVLHGERWGRAGRLGTWKVPIRKVP